MSCGVVRRHGSDLELLWLWCRLVGAALIGPLAWEHPYAMGAALEKAKKKKKRKKGKKKKKRLQLSKCSKYLSSGSMWDILKPFKHSMESCYTGYFYF